MKMKIKTIVVLLTLLMLTGCQKSGRVNYNLKNDANNFKIRRKVVALNTRTNEPLFTVEGYISLETDNDGAVGITSDKSSDKR